MTGSEVRMARLNGFSFLNTPYLQLWHFLFIYYERKKVLEEIKCIKKIIPLNGLEYAKTAKKYQLDYFVHGDDWVKGPQSKDRQLLIMTMRKWNGKVLKTVYQPFALTMLKKKEF